MPTEHQLPDEVVKQIEEQTKWSGDTAFVNQYIKGAQIALDYISQQKKSEWVKLRNQIPEPFKTLLVCKEGDDIPVKASMGRGGTLNGAKCYGNIEDYDYWMYFEYPQPPNTQQP